MSILVRNGRLVTPEICRVIDVLIEKDAMTAVGKSLPGSAETVLDATNRPVIPDGIDIHTRLDAPVWRDCFQRRFRHRNAAAAHTGSTCTVDFATRSKGHSLSEALDRWQEEASKATIDFGLHMHCGLLIV